MMGTCADPLVEGLYLPPQSRWDDTNCRFGQARPPLAFETLTSLTAKESDVTPFEFS